MKTFFLLKDIGFGEQEATLIYDLNAVEDAMLIMLPDDLINSPVALFIYKVDARNWQIEADGTDPIRIEELIHLLEEYFTEKRYKFHKVYKTAAGIDGDS